MIEYGPFHEFIAILVLLQNWLLQSYVQNVDSKFKSERKTMSAKERKNVMFARKSLTFLIDVIFSLTKVR